MKKIILILSLLAILATPAAAYDLKVHSMAGGATDWDFDGTLEVAAFVLTATTTEPAQAVVYDATTTTFKIDMEAAANNPMVIVFPRGYFLPIASSVYVESASGVAGVYKGRLQIFYR